MFSKYLKIVWLLLCSTVLLTTSSQAAGLMLAKAYDKQIDVTGWLMSEKLDGVRGYWTGKQLLSKNGNILHPPKVFVQDLPPFPLEGELWGGRNSFEKTVSIVKKQQAHDGWLHLKLAIFDVPNTPGGFTERMRKAEEWFSARPSQYAFIIPQTRVADHNHLQQELSKIEELGGEGLIVRKAEALYTAGRSTEVLKVKNYQDAEAVVISHIPGKGKNEGRLGSILVELNNGKQFKIGSGFSDAERSMPPPIGSVITFKFYGKYQSGTPKFPSYLRIRHDQNL
ncbi:DNA ligase [Desulfosediminicola flagellatus]|uniref:DNA ligase n=1 Tax=Desulfosediminicola flagellatus TaxID=2569541 RepID=UPI001C3E240E|nr:DNA ligase [Desulfosediminicola flagellatus]